MTATTLLSKTVTTTAGVTHIDLAFSAAMAKGRGTIFVTDGAVQTVIDRVTGEPKLRVVGATVTKEIPLSQVTIGSGGHVSFDVPGLAAGKHYNIYMGAGTLSSGGTPFAGYTVPNQVGFDLAAAPPALGATFNFAETTLKSGQDIAVLVTLSRSVSSLSAAAFTAENASVQSVFRTENPLVWKVVLTKAAAVADAENVLRLDLAQVEIAPGQHGSGVAISSAYAVDTLVGAWVSKAGSGRDTGASDEDNLVNSTAPYLTGELHGGLDNGDTIELVINGAAIDPARVQVNHDSSPWTWSYSPAEGGEEHYLHEGQNTIVVRVKNAEGHSSATYTTVVTVDTAAPEIDVSPDGAVGVPLSADIVITFKELLYWTDGESDTMGIIVYSADDDSYRTVHVDAGPFANGGNMLTLDPGALGLAAGKHYELRLPEGLTDYAGNSLAHATIGFQTASAPDTTGPSATHAIVDGGLFYKAGDTITFRIQFDETIRPASDAILSVGLSNGQRAELVSIDGNEASFRYTVVAGAGVDTLDLTITDASQLVDNIEDLAHNPLTGAHIIFDGIERYLGSGYGYLAVDVVVDTVAPDALAAPVLAAGSDSGTVGDNLTNVRMPTLKGSAEARAWVEIYEGATYLGGARADAAGNLEADVETSLADGLHNLTVRQTDRAGNQSAGTAYALTIDATAPGAPTGTPDLAAASDSGVSDSDNITSVRTPTFTGGGALADTGVALFANGVEIGRTAANPSGNWSFTVPGAKALADGTYAITVRQFDAAGNMSGDSGALSVSVDNIGPSASTASFNLSGGARFVLPFSEAIVFQPGGIFNLLQGGTQRDAYHGNSGAGWSISADSHGDLSVLNFNISLNGLLHMQWNNGSVTDLAGNAAIVGVAGWDFELPVSA